MELSQNTISVLKNFHAINPSIMFRKGNVLKTMSPRESIFAKAILKETFPKDFGIYDLGKMLGALSLFEAPEIEIGESHMIISGSTGDTTQRINLTFANEQSIKAVDKRMVPTRGDPIAKILLKNEVFQHALKTASILGLKEIEFRNAEGTLTLNGISTRDATTDTFSIALGDMPNVDGDIINFNVVLSTELLRMVQADYIVTICKPIKKQGGWTGTMVEFNAPNIMYGVGFEVKQTTFER